MNIDDLSLADILDRCRECQHCGAPTHFVGGDPKGRPTIDVVVEGKRRKLFVRRVVYQLRYPARTLPDGRQRVVTSSCENHRCVNPELIHVATRSEAWVRAGAKGQWTDPVARLKTVRAVRAKSKLPDHGVDDIRNSTETIAVLASRWGVSPTYVSMVRKGRYRRPLASPFAGLGA